MKDIKALLKNNSVHFAYYRKGYLYYTIDARDGGSDGQQSAVYIFPVPLEDVGDASFNAVEKALLFMRYIRKAQEEGSFVRYQS
jgi:hypothetical protein